MSKAQELAKVINRELGTTALKMGSDESLKVSYFPTGVLPIDIVFQGGIPRGRFTEIYGDPSTLKSYIAQSHIAQVQQQGGTAALIDTEHAFDPEWATAIGINVDDLIIWPNRDDGEMHIGEEAIDVAQQLIHNKVDTLVFDSIAAALPQDEANKRMYGENIQPGRLAHLMSAACRKLTATNDQTAMLWINQTRENIGITFGRNIARPGGKAMGFYASYRLEVRGTGKETRDVRLFDGEKWVKGREQTGQHYRAMVEKSKLNRPYGEVLFTYNLEAGQIDLPRFLVAQGIEHGIVSVSGKTWLYGPLKAVGRPRFMKALLAAPDVLKALEGDVRAFHGLVAKPKRRKVRRSRG